MPHECYISKNFSHATVDRIERANRIIANYQADGLVLTVRQLYYQFVSRDWIANNAKSYDSLVATINDARLAGLIDWEAIEDRTRGTVIPSRWDSPAEIMDGAARAYHRDLWATQPRRVEVWIEKEALAGVLESACRELDCPFLACRGYTSQSEMWRAGKRIREHAENGQPTVILHLGDHDPSGIDMSRDIEDRLKMFIGGDLEDELTVDRIALNLDQIKKYNPPPNPAKSSDCRFEDYRRRFGNKSWELDALEPAALVKLVREKVKKLTAPKAWRKAVALQESERSFLSAVADKWDSVCEFLDQ